MSLLFCGSLFLFSALTILLATLYIFYSVSDWLDRTEVEITRLQYNQVTSNLKSQGTLISNLLQAGFTDLHMVSNAEKITTNGFIPMTGTLQTREWSPMMADFINNKDTTFTDNYITYPDGHMQTINLSLYTTNDCQV